MPYSSKIQQRLRAKLPPEPLERFECVGVRDLGVDVHRHIDLRTAQDAHGNPRMHVERRSRVAQVCLMSCTVIRRKPALAQRVSKRRFRFRGSNGVPAREVNTSPLWTQTLFLGSAGILVLGAALACVPQLV